MDEHPVLPWMVEYAAVLLNRSEVLSDGFTAYHRLKGKDGAIQGISFG